MSAQSNPSDLTPFFAPRSVAVVGASARPTSSGGAVLHMMQKAGYTGKLVPVNPKGGTLLGIELCRLYGHWMRRWIWW
ncbi:hypothetical protein JCM17843_22270 [Kordiimonadales bacterium JCM 17843]|nr:hypothetical protein JCM17843_22270 [Kordiimonadales bacterium JCM 17843]